MRTFSKFFISIVISSIALDAFCQYSELWGVAYIGGANDAGYIYKMDHNADNYQVMYELPGSDLGGNPHTKLVEGPNGLLYGLAAKGGTHGKGVIFTYDRTYNSYNIDYHLDIYVGDALTLAPNGKFYTLTSSYYGAICEYDPVTKTLSIAYDYSNAEGKLALASGVLVLVRDSLLYGVTYSGGSNDAGVLFEYNVNSGVYEVKHHFNPTEGSKPNGHIAYDNGKIFGATVYGGSSNKGVLFEYNIDADTCYIRKHFTSIHTSPLGVCIGPDGNIYGHVSIGGSGGGGAIWRYDTTTYIFDFVQEFFDEGNPSLPTGAPMVTYNGKIFGATRYGGSGMGLGVIYEYDIATETVVIKQSLNNGFPVNTVLTELGERAVTDISIESSVSSIDIDNGTLQLGVTMQPVEANGQAAVWNVDNSTVASISSNGLLTAKANGIVTVKAIANYGLGVSDSVTITITNQDDTPPVIPVTSLTVTSSTDIITSLSNSLQMDANILPADASDPTVNWFVSDNSIASISASGILTPLKAGKVTVTAVSNANSGIYHAKEVEIINYVTSIIITPETSTISEPYGSIDFDATVLPADATIPDIYWSVDLTSKASIAQDGLFTALANTLSHVTVTAKAKDGSGIFATHNVTLSNQDSGVPVSSVNVSAPSTSIDIDGGTLQCTAAVLPAEATNKTLTWACFPEGLATVDENGLVTALKNGTVSVMAKAINNSYGLKIIDITNQSAGPFSLEEIVLTPQLDTIKTKGGALQLGIELLPSNGEYSDFSWLNGDTSLVSISEDGLVTALADGTVEITAYAKDLSGTFVISNTVSLTITNQTDPAVLVSSLNILADRDSIDIKGDSLTLTTEIQPANASNKTVSWSVDKPEIASVSPEGILTAIDNGIVTVTATANDGSGISNTKQITIINQEDIIPVEVIIIASVSDEISIANGTMQATAEILPNNASNSGVSWLVNDTSVAEISETGLLTAKNNGVITVTAIAKDGTEVSASKLITVLNQNPTVLVSNVTIVSTQDYIDVDDDTLMLSASLLPANVSVQTVSWSLDKSDIASISSEGVLTALKDGSVTVTATALDGSGIFGSKVFILSNQLIPVNSVNIISSQYYIDEQGGSLLLNADVFPIDASDNSIEWDVDHSNIATISPSGELTAVSDGIVTVTASANDGFGVSDSKAFTVINQNVLDIENLTAKGVTIFPNPAQDFITVECTSAEYSNIEIVDLTGKTLLNVPVASDGANNINVSKLKSGTYILKLIGTEKSLNEILLIQ